MDKILLTMDSTQAYMLTNGIKNIIIVHEHAK